jgi:hypothetical protein
MSWWCIRSAIAALCLTLLAEPTLLQGLNAAEDSEHKIALVRLAAGHAFDRISGKGRANLITGQLGTAGWKSGDPSGGFLGARRCRGGRRLCDWFVRFGGGQRRSAVAALDRWGRFGRCGRAAAARLRAQAGQWRKCSFRECLKVGAVVGRVLALLDAIPEREFSGIDGVALAYADYYMANGTIKGSWKGRKYGGSWSVDGDTICIDYQGTQNDACYAIFLNRDRILAVDKKSGKEYDNGAQIVPGNPAGF